MTVPPPRPRAYSITDLIPGVPPTPDPTDDPTGLRISGDLPSRISLPPGPRIDPSSLPSDTGTPNTSLSGLRSPRIASDAVARLNAATAAATRPHEAPPPENPGPAGVGPTERLAGLSEGVGPRGPGGVGPPDELSYLRSGSDPQHVMHIPRDPNEPLTLSDQLGELRARRLGNALDEATLRHLSLSGMYSEDPTLARIAGLEKESALEGAMPVTEGPSHIGISEGGEMKYPGEYNRDVGSEAGPTQFGGAGGIPGLTPSRAQAYATMISQMPIQAAQGVMDWALRERNRINGLVASGKLKPAQAAQQIRAAMAGAQAFANTYAAMTGKKVIPGLGGAFKDPSGLAGADIAGAIEENAPAAQ